MTWKGAPPALTKEQSDELMGMKPALAEARRTLKMPYERALAWGASRETVRKYLLIGPPKRYAGKSHD